MAHNHMLGVKSKFLFVLSLFLIGQGQVALALSGGNTYAAPAPSGSANYSVYAPDAKNPEISAAELNDYRNTGTVTASIEKYFVNTGRKVQMVTDLSKSSWFENSESKGGNAIGYNDRDISGITFTQNPYFDVVGTTDLLSSSGPTSGKIQ